MRSARRVAIGIGYDEHIDLAPIVLFCCQDELVTTIVDVAQRYGVPVIEEIDLVRNLSKIKPGKEIPTTLYYQVASLFHKLPK